MRALYEIDDEIRAIWDNAEVDEDGEIHADFEALEALNIEREAKVEGVAMLRKETEAMRDAVKEEIKRLKERVEGFDKELESLDGYLRFATGEESFETAKAKISFRRSTRLIVDDEGSIPKKWWKKKTTETIDKAGMKDAILKEGKSIKGVHVEEYKNMKVG